MGGAVRAVITAVISAVEAVAVALAGFVLVAVPMLLVWWLEFDLGADPGAVVAGAAGGWLLAHLVPLTFALTPEAALGLGLDPSALSFSVSLVPLGITVVTVALAARAGWRLAVRGGPGSIGLLGGAVGFGVAAGVAATLATTFVAWPVWAAILIPMLCYGLSASAAFLVNSGLRRAAWWTSFVRGILRGLQPRISEAPDGARESGRNWVAALPMRAADTLRLASGAVLGLVGLGAAGVAVAVIVGYVDVVTLSQGLQLDWLGMVALLLLDLALLPVACAWALAWFSGSGFAIGAGSSVTPFETLLGPMPAFPLFGAIPDGWGWAGGLAPALVVLLAVGIGALAGGRTSLRHSSLIASIVVPVLAAAASGLAVAGLAALSSGAIGPERLAIAGPRPWLTGGLVALELAVGLVPGVLARRLDADRMREILPIPGKAEAASTEPGAADAETVPLTPLEPVALREISGGHEAETHDETIDLVEATDPGYPSEPQETAELQEPTEPTEKAEPAEQQDPTDSDALLRAYSWENAPAPEEGASESTRGPRGGGPRTGGTRDWRSLWRR